MFQDILGLPVTGGALLAGAAYAALSVFVTGPLVAERTIDKSGWAQHCARHAKASVSPPPATPRPNLDCAAIIGTLYGREGAAFCARHGNALALPFGMLGALAHQPVDALQRRAADQAARAESACGCAMAVVLEARRVDFAIHAGSARLITPMPVRDLPAELARARSSSVCSAKG